MAWSRKPSRADYQREVNVQMKRIIAKGEASNPQEAELLARDRAADKVYDRVPWEERSRR